MSDRGLQYWQQHGQYEQETGAADPANHSATSQGGIMHIDKFSQSKYVKQGDVSQPMLVTIDQIKVENVARKGEEKENRCVVYFAEFEKGMVFNKTNLSRAAKAIGSTETDDWIGHKLVLYVDDEVEMGGEIVGGLRVRAVKKQVQAELARKPTPEPDPDPRYRDEPKQAGSAVNVIRDMKDDIPY